MALPPDVVDAQLLEGEVGFSERGGSDSESDSGIVGPTSVIAGTGPPASGRTAGGGASSANGGAAPTTLGHNNAAAPGGQWGLGHWERTFREYEVCCILTNQQSSHSLVSDCEKGVKPNA